MENKGQEHRLKLWRWQGSATYKQSKTGWNCVVQGQFVYSVHSVSEDLSVSTRRTFNTTFCMIEKSICLVFKNSCWLITASVYLSVAVFVLLCLPSVTSGGRGALFTYWHLVTQWDRYVHYAAGHYYYHYFLQEMRCDMLCSDLRGRNRRTAPALIDTDITALLSFLSSDVSIYDVQHTKFMVLSLPSLTCWKALKPFPPAALTGPPRPPAAFHQAQQNTVKDILELFPLIRRHKILNIL